MHLHMESLQCSYILISCLHLSSACFASRGVSSQFALGGISFRFIFLGWSSSCHQYVSVSHHFDSGHLLARIVHEGVAGQSFW